jgi:hypothetical protein
MAPGNKLYGFRLHFILMAVDHPGKGKLIQGYENKRNGKKPHQTFQFHK